MWWFFWISHMIISIVFGILAIKLRGKLGFCYLIIFLLIPFSGFLFALISVIYEITNKENDKIDLRGIMSREEKEENIISHYNYDEKINIVPLEEALLIDNVQVKRHLMLEVLKSDASKYVKQLKLAINDNDSETSHYAASAMLEIKRQFENIIKELIVKYEKNKQNDSITIELIRTIYHYMKMDLMDSNSKFKFAYILGNAGQELIKRNNEIDSVVFKEIMETFIELKEFVRAIDVGYIYLKSHTSFEEPYLLLMKVYYIQNKKEAFLDILSTLRKSPVKLSNNAITLVRYWIGGINKNVSA